MPERRHITTKIRAGAVAAVAASAQYIPEAILLAIHEFIVKIWPLIRKSLLAAKAVAAA